MRFGCCAGPEQADFLSDVGYDYLEPTVTGHLIPEKSEEDFKPIRDKFLSAKIKPEAFNCFLPGDLKVIGENVDTSRLTGYVEVAFHRASEVGSKIIVFGSGSARMIPERFFRDKAWEQMKKALELIVPVAQKNGIVICVEPLLKKACNFLNRVDEVEKLVREINKPEIKTLADLFHITWEEEQFSNLVYAKNNLAHIHVPVPDIEGVAPYEKSFDHKKFFFALKQASYNGRVTLEDNGGRLKNWNENLPRILTYLKKTCIF